MEGTRKAIIDDIVEWATNFTMRDTSPSNSNADNVFWVYGIPGIGKTDLANSICRRLHISKNLGGCFFCRRDDPVLSQPKRVLPTLIYRLAGMLVSYRNLVVQALRDDPHLTPYSASGEFLLTALELLKKKPSRTMVLVIDAFDECGTPNTRKPLLNCLISACLRANWLKLIMICRPERDIQSCFEASGVTGQDLAQDVQIGNDIRYFSQKCLSVLLESHSLPDDWPGEARHNKIILRSRGLFIYIETIFHLLSASKDPDVPLDMVLGGQFQEDNTELHKLYLTAIEAQFGQETRNFQLIARAIVAVAPYRPLCDETLASLTGEKPHVIKT